MERNLPVPLSRSGSTQHQLERHHLSVCVCTHTHTGHTQLQCESFVSSLLLSYLRVWIKGGLQVLSLWGESLKA